MHVLFFIRVAEDDDVVVTERPKKFAVKFAEESPDELLVPHGVREDFLLIGRKIHHWDRLRGPSMLMNW
jgi:hypothetical protein